MSTIRTRQGFAMLRYYYINKEWIVSRKARGIYRVAAGLSVMLFVTLVAVFFAGNISENALSVVRLIVFAGVLGTATTIVAMEYFLFGFDSSSAPKKAFWFCVMLLPFGSALYCFIVYSRSSAIEG